MLIRPGQDVQLASFDPQVHSERRCTILAVVLNTRGNCAALRS